MRYEDWGRKGLEADEDLGLAKTQGPGPVMELRTQRDPGGGARSLRLP